MLTVVEERQGIPLAVVKGGRPAKGDTIWLGDVPYCVTGIDRDTILVKPGAWNSPNCGSPDTIRRKAGTLYNVNPSPASFSGYRAKQNPLDLPNYQQGPAFSPGYQRPYSQAGPSIPRQFVPTMGIPPVMESHFQAPHKLRAYHYMYRFPIFDLETYRPPRPGEKEVFDGVEYEYTKVVNDKALLVRPIVPWVAFVIAEDKSSGSGMAWVPITNLRQVSGAKQWLKKKLDREQGIARKQYHLYRKSGRQLQGYFRNNPNNHLPTYRRT